MFTVDTRGGGPAIIRVLPGRTGRFHLPAHCSRTCAIGGTGGRSPDAARVAWRRPVEHVRGRRKHRRRRDGPGSSAFRLRRQVPPGLVHPCASERVTAPLAAWQCRRYCTCWRSSANVPTRARRKRAALPLRVLRAQLAPHRDEKTDVAAHRMSTLCRRHGTKPRSERRHGGMSASLRRSSAFSPASAISRTRSRCICSRPTRTPALSASFRAFRRAFDVRAASRFFSRRLSARAARAASAPPDPAAGSTPTSSPAPLPASASSSPAACPSSSTKSASPVWPGAPAPVTSPPPAADPPIIPPSEGRTPSKPR
jgi:hypothetical protein